MTTPMMVRTTRIVLVVVGCAVAACGGPGAGGDSDHGSPAAGLPSGYALRLDRDNRDPADFIATLEEGNLEVRTGPAGILYRPDQHVDGDRFAVRARFTEVGAPVGHREGFGLFIGGQGLVGVSQRYTYFLVRSDGRYLIKQRDGGDTWDLSDGWEPSSAIRLPTDGGSDVTNELAITVDGARVRFVCNGESLADLPSDDVSARGVVGLRVNHNLNVRIAGFQVEP